MRGQLVLAGACLTAGVVLVLPLSSASSAPGPAPAPIVDHAALGPAAATARLPRQPGQVAPAQPQQAAAAADQRRQEALYALRPADTARAVGLLRASAAMRGLVAGTAYEPVSYQPWGSTADLRGVLVRVRLTSPLTTSATLPVRDPRFAGGFSARLTNVRSLDVLVDFSAGDVAEIQPVDDGVAGLAPVGPVPAPATIGR